jgi:hypothetical protein
MMTSQSIFSVPSHPLAGTGYPLTFEGGNPKRRGFGLRVTESWLEQLY